MTLKNKSEKGRQFFPEVTLSTIRHITKVERWLFHWSLIIHILTRRDRITLIATESFVCIICVIVTVLLVQFSGTFCWFGADCNVMVHQASTYSIVIVQNIKGVLFIWKLVASTALFHTVIYKSVIERHNVWRQPITKTCPC